MAHSFQKPANSSILKITNADYEAGLKVLTDIYGSALRPSTHTSFSTIYSILSQAGCGNERRFDTHRPKRHLHRVPYLQPDDDVSGGETLNRLGTPGT